MRTLAFTAFALTCGGLLATPATADWHRGELDLMGTRVSVELWHEDAAAGERAVQAVLDEYRRVDALMSTFRDDSEIARVNREAAQRPVPVGEALFAVVREAQALAEMSDGAFDITFDSVGRHYDFRSGEAPGSAELEQGLPLVDYRLVELDEGAHSIRFRAEGVRINLGGIAKGWAVERGAATARAHGVGHGVFNAGGDTRVLGDRRGQPWVVGLRDPRDPEGVVVRLPLVDEAISTSGDYERYFERDGERHHHILDPGTGRSAGGVRSATVIGPDATRVDGLSTAVFVLGVERGMQLVALLPGYEAVMVDADGRVYHSDGLGVER